MAWLEVLVSQLADEDRQLWVLGADAALKRALLAAGQMHLLAA